MLIEILNIITGNGKLFLKIDCPLLHFKIYGFDENSLPYDISEKTYNKYCENNYPGSERFIPFKQRIMNEMIGNNNFRRIINSYINMVNDFLKETNDAISTYKYSFESFNIKALKKSRKDYIKSLHKLNKMLNKTPIEMRLLMEIEW